MSNRTVSTIGLGFFALSLAIALPAQVGAAPGGGGPSHVIVDNTGDQPVPTYPIGVTPVSGSVNIANQPTVDARQSGAWSVGIAGTADVNVVNTPTVALAGTPAVMVVNGNVPVNVHDVDHVARTYYTESSLGGLAAAESGRCSRASLTIPAGQRFVLQHWSAYIDADPTDDLLVSLETIYAGSNSSDWVVPAQTRAGSRVRVVNQQTTVYGDFEQRPCVMVQRAGALSGHDVNFAFTITGYLEPM